MRRITHRGIEVKIGDIISVDSVSINGITVEGVFSVENTVTLTEKIVELNPNLFKVEEIPDYFKCINARENGGFTLGKIYKLKNYKEYPRKLYVTTDNLDTVGVFSWTEDYVHKDHNCFKPSTKRAFEKQEMLAKAIKDYPVGTVFRSLISPDQIQEVIEATHSIETTFGNGDLYVVVRTDKHFGGGSLFHNGEWAEILELKFVSEDGVKIYDGMKTYMIHKHDTAIDPVCIGNWSGDSSTYKYFYYEENAEQYLKDIKFKENLLIEARKRYPIGTKFLSATNSSIKSFYTVNNEVIWEKNRIVAEKFGAAVYDNNQSRWAEIIGKTLVEQLDQLIFMIPPGEIRNILYEALIQVQMNEKCIILTKNDLKNLAPFNIHDVTWQDFKESSITKQELREAEVVIFIYESLSKVLKNKY